MKTLFTRCIFASMNSVNRLCVCALNVLLFTDPTNGRVLQNVEKYEKLLFAATPSRGDVLRRPTTNYLRTKDTYERLCQTQGSQVAIKEIFRKHTEHQEMITDENFSFLIGS